MNKSKTASIFFCSEAFILEATFEATISVLKQWHIPVLKKAASLFYEATKIDFKKQTQQYIFILIAAHNYSFDIRLEKNISSYWLWMLKLNQVSFPLKKIKLLLCKSVLMRTEPVNIDKWE